jgi:outer membrane protein insertion porin family
MDFGWYIPVTSRQVLLLGFHGRDCEGDAIEIGDCYRLGGTLSLRGYRENQFPGTRIAWTNTEYRFLLGGASSFYGFFDSGYFYLPDLTGSGAPLLQDTRYGYGVGIRLETSLGIIGVSLAYGQGDSFADGKIHIGLINDF